MVGKVANRDDFDMTSFESLRTFRNEQECAEKLCWFFHELTSAIGDTRISAKNLKP